MTIPKQFACICLGVALLGGVHQAFSQGAETPNDRSMSFRTRLSVVPITVAMQDTVAGSGSVTATLNGRRLTVMGSFDGLKSPATVARIHLAAPGIRGPAILDLTVTKATSGTISGSLDLTPAQVEELRNKRFYVQLHSERAPDGNLWGWLLR